MAQRTAMHAMKGPRPAGPGRGPTGVDSASRSAATAPPEPHSPFTAAGNMAVQRALSGGLIQPKLEIGSPNDPAEREADEVADAVVNGKSACTCGGTCDECRHNGATSRIQRKSEGGGNPAGSSGAGKETAPPHIMQDLGPGQPLDPPTRRYFESRMGHDFSRTRIHTNLAAARAAASIHAKAFTHGNDIAFASGRHRTDHAEGRRLLGHELTHVVQQGRGEGAPTLQRQGDDIIEPRAPTTMSMQVTLSGMTFKPAPGASFAPGPKLPQAARAVLDRLIGDQYRQGDEDDFIHRLRRKYPDIAFPNLEGSATGGEPFLDIIMPVIASLELARWARDKEYSLALSDAQRDILFQGFFVESAFRDLQNSIVQEAIGASLPEWYSQYIFTRQMARHGVQLRAYIEAVLAYDQDRSEASRRLVLDALDAIFGELLSAALVVDAIRGMDELQSHEAYRALFGGSTETASAASSTAPAAGRANQGDERREIPRSQALNMFVTYLSSQQQLVERVERFEVDAARELLDRFWRFTGRAITGVGDELVVDAPGGANAPPHPATMTSFPQLQPPLFDAALGTDHSFVMSLQFPDVFSAFAHYHFAWERVRIPDDQIGQPVDVERLQGDRPSAWETAEARFDRVGRYNRADVERSIQSTIGILGVAPGVSAPNLILANNILRYLGAGIRLVFEFFTEPANEERILFPEEGLYIVRCRAIPIVEHDTEVVRAPSVAYIPVLARSPEEMAQQRARASMSAEARAHERANEIEERLAHPSLPDTDRGALEEELRGIRASTASIAEMLDHQLTLARRRQSELSQTGETHTAEYVALERQIDELTLMIAHRSDRAAQLEGAERLHATFVSDLGQTLQLAVEAAELEASGTRRKYFVSDVTTRHSGHARAWGDNKSDAICNALRGLLEGTHGYGRGYLSVAIDGAVINLRIEASEGQILVEAIENLTTVASIAAVAAAPFTGGATLSLLLPIGAVGMIPSAYRLASRAEMGTLDFDLETAMDVVNIVGGVVGLGQAITPLRYVRLGRALMIVGFGADGLGVLLMPAQLMQEIEALEGLSPGQRAARLLEIIGSSMLDAGISVGTSLARRAQGQQIEVETTIATGDPRLARVAGLEAASPVQLDGTAHRIRIGVDESGQLVVRLCSSPCDSIVARLEVLLRRPDTQPEVRRKVVEAHRDALALQQDLRQGGTQRAEGQRRLDDLRDRVNQLATEHPDQLSMMFTSETPAQHERRGIQEYLEQHARSGPAELILHEPMYEGSHNTVKRIAQELARHIDLPQGVDVSRPTREFLARSNPEVATLLEIHGQAIDMAANSGGSLREQGRRRLLDLGYSEAMVGQIQNPRDEMGRRIRAESTRLRGPASGLRPDLVHIDFERRTIRVLDFTQIPNHPWHNLKTRLYRAILTELTGFDVSAADVHKHERGGPVVVEVD